MNYIVCYLDGNYSIEAQDISLDVLERLFESGEFDCNGSVMDDVTDCAYVFHVGEHSEGEGEFFIVPEGVVPESEAEEHEFLESLYEYFPSPSFLRSALAEYNWVTGEGFYA
jgi:hypothetical protein